MMMMMSGTLQPAGQAPQQPQKPRYVDTNAPQVVGVNNIGQPQPPAVALLPNTQPVSDVYLNASQQPNTVGAPAYPTPLMGGSNLINSNGGGSGMTVPIECTAIEQVQVPNSVNGGGMRTISVQKQLPASITIPMDGGGGMANAMSPTLPTMVAPPLLPAVPNGMAMVPVASLANPTAPAAGGLTQLPTAASTPPVATPEPAALQQQPPAEAPKEGPNWFAWTALGAGALAAIFFAMSRGKGSPTGPTGAAPEAAVKQLDAMWHNINPAKMVNADDVTFQKGNPIQKGMGSLNHVWGLNRIPYNLSTPLWKTGLTQNAKNAHKAIRQLVGSTPKKELAASTEAFHSLGEKFTAHVGGGNKHLGRAIRENFTIISQSALNAKDSDALKLAFLEGSVSKLEGRRLSEVLRAARPDTPFHKDHHAAIKAFVQERVPNAKDQAYILKQFTGSSSTSSITKEFVRHNDQMADSFFAHTPPAELFSQAGLAGPVAAPVAGMVPATA